MRTKMDQIYTLKVVPQDTGNRDINIQKCNPHSPTPAPGPSLPSLTSYVLTAWTFSHSHTLLPLCIP